MTAIPARLRPPSPRRRVPAPREGRGEEDRAARAPSDRSEALCGGGAADGFVAAFGGEGSEIGAARATEAHPAP
ncbi:hypothetical protein GCM10010363_40960 [Streptomyces omiyaensis]|nr:hypothetical protein GCM10010363_40960 [Streptomyces omiyaensis]